MIFDDLIPTDSNAFLTNDVDYYSIYDSSPEEKKFFDKVLGLRVSVSDDPEFSSVDMQKEDDQTVPTKASELAPFSSVASPASVLGGDGPEPSSYDNIRAPPPSYEEHKVFSKFHPQSFSCEDLAARWQDIQDIISRESSITTSDGILSLSVSKSTTQPIATDDPFQSSHLNLTRSEISKLTNSSDIKMSIAQSPAWCSTSVQESSFYSTSPESNSLVPPPPRSSNSSPASFAPPFNSFSASPSSNPTFYEASSRCSPSPLLKQNNNPTTTTTNNNNHNSNTTTITTTPTTTTTTTVEPNGIVCGMSYQQLKSYIPESGHIQLWQFLLKLLCEPANGNCIRWEGDKGHFTIINQAELAKRWGERKQRKHMTYEKLSRAIRYYYDKNYVKKIHGKKATYAFNFEELFKSHSRPGQSKSKESSEISSMSPPVKIPKYQNSLSSSSSSSPSSSFSSCAQNSNWGNNPSVIGNNYPPEMNSYVEYGLPQPAKKIKTEFEGYGNRVPPYFGQEQEYNPSIPYMTSVTSLFEDEHFLLYH